MRVHDDAVEARQQPAPQVALLGRAARQQVVRREDRRRAEAHERVGLRQRQPLDVQHVGAPRRERADDAGVLQRLQRQARARALEEARRERIEALDAPVADRWRQLREAETRRRDLDQRARRGRARRRARGRTTACTPAGLRSGRARFRTVEADARPGLEPPPRQDRPTGRAAICARWSSSRPPTGPRSSASRRCRLGRSSSVGEWAGMQAVTARTIAPKLGPIRVPAGFGKMLGSPGKGNAILLPKRRDDPPGEADHAQHEPLLRGAGRQARADAEARALVGARAARLPHRQGRVPEPAAHADREPARDERRRPAARGRRAAARGELRRPAGRDRGDGRRRRRLQHHARGVRRAAAI